MPSELVSHFTVVHLINLFVGCFAYVVYIRKELPSDAVILSSKYGQLYQCTYPPVPSQNAKENESKANNMSVVELLNPMKPLPCLFLVCIRFISAGCDAVIILKYAAVVP